MQKGIVAKVFIHTADVHLGYKQYKSVVREQDFFDTFLQFAERAEELKPDFTIIAGDLFDSRVIGPRVYSRASEILGVFTHPVICIEGNHDRQLSQEFTWMNLLAKEGKIILLSPDFKNNLFEEYDGERGYYVRIGDQVIKGMRYMGSMTKRCVSRLPLDEGDILILHTGVDKYSFVTTADLLSLKAKYIALGHYHDPFDVGKIHNPGSLETNSFAETHEKGFIVYDGKVKREPIKTRPFIREEVDVTGMGLEELKSALTINHPGAVVEVIATGVLGVSRNDFSFDVKGEALVYRVRDETVRPSQVVINAKGTRKEIEREVFHELNDELADFAIGLIEFLKSKPSTDKVIERFMEFNRGIHSDDAQQQASSLD